MMAAKRDAPAGIEALCETSLEVTVKSRFVFLVASAAAVVLASSGCLLSDPTSSSIQHHSLVSPFAPHMAANDSGPGGHSHPSPPPTIAAVVFVGSDSVAAGQTSITRWVVGNNSHSTFTLQWALTDEHGWSSLPQQGTVTLAPRSTQPLNVAVQVPDSAATGGYPLLMTVTQRNAPDATAGGFIRVTGSQDSLLTRGVRARGR